MKGIEKAIIRFEYATRGGGIEIDLTRFGYPDEKMSAYQNYLGGGMMGGIANDSTITTWKNYPKLVKIAKALTKYFAEETEQDIEELNGMPISAY
jgi:hypothetical protein